MSKSISFVATGDSFITRRITSSQNSNFKKIKDIISQGEFRFTNFEGTAHHFEGFPSAVSGGTWAIADPLVLKDLKSYGFNALAWANNHTLDYSYGGLEATERYIQKYGFIHAGVGSNLAQATAPKYVECPSGRVALIAATSTFPESWEAGEQRPDVKGRPGINPLRFETKHIVTKKNLQHLKKIAKSTEINADHNLSIKEGFNVSEKDNSFKFGKYNFEIGTVEGKQTKPSPIDMSRILNSISEAKRQADYVIVSIHTHEMEGERKNKAPQFLEEFARNCIDEGAHAIIGHGPHVLRGIEIYKERPIFYSLGNFIFQNDTITNLPHDFYLKYGMNFNHNVADALDYRSDFGKKGLGVNSHVWESVIPQWTMKDGKLEEIRLHPIDLGYGLPRYKRGSPSLSNSTSSLESIKELSKEYGTKIHINKIGIIK